MQTICEFVLSVSHTKNQSFESSIIQIAAAVIGACSTLFIYPKNLELYGVYGFLSNTASLLAPFISLGFGNVLLRYFPYYQDAKSGHRGLFGFVLTGYGIGVLFFLLVFVLLSKYLFHHFFKVDHTIQAYIPFLLPLTICLVAYELMANVCINFRRITLIARANFIFKVVLPLLFLASLLNWITAFHFAGLVCVYYLVTIALLSWILRKRPDFLIRFSRDLWKDASWKPMVRFAAYSLLTGVSTLFALRIDSFCIGVLSGAEASGIYTLALFISNVAFIPATAITDSVNPLVANHSKEQDREQLRTMYRKSANTMLVATCWLCLCILLCFPQLRLMMPNSEKMGLVIPVLYWLLTARTIDAATGVNHHILSYSPYYRYELYLLLMMAVLNTALNFILIPVWGLNGAAIASFIAISLYNILKTLVVYRLLGMHPFDTNFVKILFTGLLCFGLVYMIPLGMHPLLNIVIIGTLVSLSFLGPVWCFRWSPELDSFLTGKLKGLSGLLQK